MSRVTHSEPGLPMVVVVELKSPWELILTEPVPEVVEFRPADWAEKAGRAMKTTFPKNYVYVLRTTKPLHMVGFIDFYFHFPANFQT